MLCRRVNINNIIYNIIIKGARQLHIILLHRAVAIIFIIIIRACHHYYY